MRDKFLTLLLVASCAVSVSAQDNRLGSGVASRLADVLGDEPVVKAKEIELDDLADSVALAFDSVDRNRVATVNSELERLKDEESELRSLLDELRRGLPIDITAVGQTSAVEDIDATTLELENQTLAAMKVQVEQLEERNRKRREWERRRREAMQLTRKSEVLLASLDTLPEPDPEVDGVIAVAKTAFPGRLAHALYLARDFKGALRQYEALGLEAMDAEQRFEMARCLEEVGQVDKAIEVLGNVGGENDADGFWQGRAEGLKKFLEKSQSIRQVLDTPRKP